MFASMGTAEGYTFEDKRVILDTDIDFNNTTIMPIGDANTNFKGTFDGQNHTISNYKLEYMGSGVGLFGNINGVLICNVKIKNVTVYGSEGVTDGIAALVGYDVSSRIINCHIDGFTTGSSSRYMGGIVGSSYGTEITACSIDNAQIQFDQSHAGGTVHSVSIKCNSGVLNGVSATTGCADHTASAPSVGEAFTYVFTVTNVNESTGVVTGNVYCTAVKGSTDGVHKNEHGLIGTQRVQGTASYVGQFNGKAKLKKSSSNTTLVAGNPCYSLTGASYGVYSDAGCTSQKATFTTNENGDSNDIDVPAGKYYVKEITAPKGYYKDNTVYPLTVTSGQTATVSVTDKPGDDPAAITINKKDSEVPENGIAIGGASLEGAQFTVKYYAGYYTKDNLPENATKTWVLETKKRTRSDGTIVYQTGLTEAYKVSGDDFFLVDGLPTLPLGTISITETKAPKGYSLDNAYLTPVGSTDKSSTYVAQITMNSDAVHLQGGNEYEMNDHVLRGDFEFTKKDEEDKTPMANIPFKITSKTTGESHKIVTDENGYYSSASDFNKHSQDTNGGKKDSGLWFGQYKVGDETKITDPDDTKGALPYDTYEIEELKCDANEGKALYKGTLTITRDGYKIDMGTIENADLTLQTTAKDEASNTHYAATDDEVPLVDTVT